MKQPASRTFRGLRRRATRTVLGCAALLLVAGCATVAVNPQRYRQSAQPFQVSFDRDGHLLDDHGEAEGSEARWAEVTRELDRATRTGGGRKPLVILVHGTNPGTPQYQRMERMIESVYFPGGDVVFVEVFWPAGKLFHNLHFWGYAQHNSYGAGLGLRRLLNAVGADVPVRILTHSMGGGVAAGALWNVVSKVQTTRPSLLRWREGYLAALDSIPTPVVNDIRVGMLVPAMPGCTFHDFRRPAPGVDPYNYALAPPTGLGCGFGTDSIHAPISHPNVRRIVIGYNPNDVVIEKAVRGCRLVGASCLGSRSKEFEDYAEPIGRLGTEMMAVHITTRSKLDHRAWLLATENHAFVKYVENPANRCFFDRLFRDAAGSCPP